VVVFFSGFIITAAIVFTLLVRKMAELRSDAVLRSNQPLRPTPVMVERSRIGRGRAVR
jgi:hypothetical protein